MKTLPLLAICVAALLLNGCTGYQLGSMLPDDIRTVHVPNFSNATQEPFIVTETTKAVIQELQRDGSLEITSLEEADSILEVTITDYKLTPLAFSSSSRSRPNQYRVQLTAEVSFKRTSNQQILAAADRVSGDATFEFVGDLTTTKRQALPRVAEDLAHDIVELIVEAWY